MTNNVEVLDKKKSFVSIDAESNDYLMKFKEFWNLKRVILRSEVDYLKLFEFPNLKHIDYIEVRKSEADSFTKIKKLILLSPNEVNFEWIHLTPEQMFAMIGIIKCLTVERAIFKLVVGY